ncbi:MAG: hypothetical protein MHPSP_002070 [Paramarteilia canceri]
MTDLNDRKQDEDSNNYIGYTSTFSLSPINSMEQVLPFDRDDGEWVNWNQPTTVERVEDTLISYIFDYIEK